MKKTKESGSSEPLATDVQGSRRKFLEQAGKLGVYTAPAMMLLMTLYFKEANGRNAG